MAELSQQQQGGENHPPEASATATATATAATGAPHAPSFDDDTGTLLVVATLITALSYQVGTNIPGGYWGDDNDGHVAGDPIMRDKHRRRYWLFMVASWAGFGSSMLLTVALLTQVPTRSLVVRCAFLVSYSSLVLTFVTSQPRTWLAMDIAIWAGVMAALAVVTSSHKSGT
nr:unnamed protein product [Digitaria exilis]